MDQITQPISIPWKIKRTAWIFVCIWTFLIGSDVVWQSHVMQQNVIQIAHIQANSSFEKDLVYRRWVAGHGGVYVPVSPETPPNPDLAHIKRRDVVTLDGQKLTLVNPAYMTRQVHELAEEQFGQKGHITSLNPIREGNRPDDWEKVALQAFEEGKEEYSGVTQIGNHEYYRLMRPMITEQSCLKCHEQQGYKLGDIRGGISISIPMEPIGAIIGELRSRTLARYAMIWLLGLGAIIIVFRQFSKRTSESNDVLVKLDHKNKMQAILHKLTLKSLHVHDLDEYFKYAHDNLNSFRTVSNFAIGLLNEDNDQLEFQYFADEKSNVSIDPIPITAKDSLAIEVITTSKMLYLHGKALEERVKQKQVHVNGEIPEAWLGLPLSDEKCCQGLIMIQFYGKDRTLSEHDIKFLEDYVARIQMVLVVQENARKLTNSEKRFRIISETANDAICMINAKGILTFINRAGEEMFGYDEMELIGEPIHKHLMPPHYKNQQENAFELFKDTGVGDVIGQTVELKSLHKDGHEFPIEISLASVEMDDGWNTIAIIRDVTLRKESEEKLKKLSIAIEQSPISIVITDTQGSIEYVNPKFSKVTGYSLNEVVGKNPSILKSGEQSSAFYQSLWETINSGTTWKGEFHNVRKNGTLFWERASISPIFDEKQKITHFVAVKEDITEQKEAIDAMRRLSGVIEQDEDAIIITDALDVIEFVNPAFIKLTGFTENEVLGKDMSELKEVDSFEVYQKEIYEKLSQNLPWKKQRKTKHKNGTIIDEETIISPLLDQKFGVIKNIVIRRRDITAETLLEQQLKQSQKLESIGQLAAGIAHEINTPTQYVNDNINFMSEAFTDMKRLLVAYEKFDSSKLKDSPIHALKHEIDFSFLMEEVPSAMQQSIDGIARISKIVKAIKEFSHPGEDQKKLTDINRAIETTITVARNEWKYVAEIETSLDPDIPMVECLPGEINQVVLNVIVNAAHAIAETLPENSREKGEIAIATSMHGESVQISIQDTGSGIPEDAQPRIFDPFYTTKAVGKGTGQGLSLAHMSIVNKHGGELYFKTEEGKGTTFFIELPVQAQSRIKNNG